MPNESTPHSSIDVINGASVALVGAGVVTVALFPLAVPILILTVAATIPLLLPAAAAGLVLAVVAAPILLLRRLSRRNRRRVRAASRPLAQAKSV